MTSKTGIIGVSTKEVEHVVMYGVVWKRVTECDGVW